MERLDQEKDLKVHIMRHGPSGYKQPEWTDIETADDLTTIRNPQNESKTELADAKEKAIQMVRESAEKIADEISSDEEVMIWASPTGRTLETARIVSDVLKEKGITLRKSEDHGVKIFEKLGEVKNFKWDLFEPLMNGGEVTYEGKTFSIDKNLTNPKGLVYPEYFTQDEIKNIPQEVKDQWSKEYVKKLESFESFVSVTERTIASLERLMKLHDKNYRVIVVTHDALASSIISTFTSHENVSLDPAQFISLERKDDNLVVTRVGDIL